MRTLLDLIAESKRQQDVNLQLPTSEAVLQSDSAYLLDEKNKFQDPNDGSIDTVVINRVNEIGDLILDDVKTKNLNYPDPYERISIDYSNDNVIDSPTVVEVATNIYPDVITLNRFQPENEYSSNEIQYPELRFSNNENYFDFIGKIQNNLNNFTGTLSDVFQGNYVSDTPLGNLGADSLRKSFETNVLSNVIKDTIGYINTPFTALDRGNILNKNYKITVNPNPILKGVEIFAGLSNLTYPFSYIPSDALDITNGIPNDQELNKELLDYTGDGQKEALSDIIGNKYHAPFYLKGVKIYSPYDEKNIRSTDVLTSNSAFEYEKINVTTIGKSFDGEDLKTAWNYGDYVFSTWTQFSTAYSGGTDSLLSKTQQLVDKFGDKNVFIDTTKKQLLVDEGDGTILLSRGDTMTALSEYIDDDGTTIPQGDYLRVWTKLRGYNQLNRAIRHRGLDAVKYTRRSVLGENGIPRYAPTFRDSTGLMVSPKRYMFSLENLAWADFFGDLPECEQGLGDFDGTRGRLMWFPPYGLDINENVQVGFEEYDFLGRGEKVYTYQNTARTGTLKFQIITDHPLIVNKVKQNTSQIWERYFKGDKSKEILDAVALAFEALTPSEQQLVNDAFKKPDPPTVVISKPVVTPDKQTENDKLSDEQIIDILYKNFGDGDRQVYFPNQVVKLPVNDDPSYINNGYENGDGVGLGTTTTDIGKIRKWEDKTDFGLNIGLYDWFDNIVGTKLIEKGEGYIYIWGFASKQQPLSTTNNELAKKRAENLQKRTEEVINNVGLSGKFSFVTLFGGDKYAKTIGQNIESLPRDQESIKQDRFAKLYILSKQEAIDLGLLDVTPPTNETLDGILSGTTITTVTPPDPNNLQPNNPLANIPDTVLDKLLYTECDFFKYIETYHPLSYNTIQERIKYFHPAYHSITPQGFNSRLTFLHQCTRQAQNIGFDGVDNTSNLAFGRPPVCILRIGDFFHTKILITNMSIDYNVSDNITWDLNPEGIGIQPMMANISLEIVYLGGQAIDAPIKRLQNALSYNFYANTEIYEPFRADKWTSNNGVKVIEDGKKLSQLTSNATIVKK